MFPNPDDVNLRAAHARMVDGGLLRPVAETLAEGSRFRDCDLASLLENRRGETLDGLKLNRATRARAEEALAPDEELPMPHLTPAMGTAFWILDGKDVAGTVMFTHRLIGTAWMFVSSLYVRPAFRGRGLSSRLMRQAFAQAVAVGAHGIRMGTQWAWPEAVNLYLRLGCWVDNWRRDLVFVMDRTLPTCRVEMDGERAEFRVSRDGGEQHLITAWRRGDTLGWAEHAAAEVPAMATFSLHLAARGWPLIRSAEAWEAQRAAGAAGAGTPESLAWRIAWFETWERQRGFNVRAPRIPGLVFPAEEELFPEG
jgi:GNAT superfamily N-acetyltransferase